MDKAPIVSRKLEINSYEADQNARLKTVSLQHLLQEIAYKGSDFCQCGPDVMRSRNLFWALNRIHFSILDCPSWGAEVILQTWSRGQVGPLWHRNFRMVRESAPDVPIVLGTSAWTVVDAGERSLFRGELGFDASFHYSEDTLPFCSKLIIPRDLPRTEAGTHKVVWSDIDTNGHANNCAYTQWVLDLIPVDYVKSHLVKDVQVNYQREVHYGEEVAFELAQEGDVWYVTGKAGDLVCFIERIEFA